MILCKTTKHTYMIYTHKFHSHWFQTNGHSEVVFAWIYIQYFNEMFSYNATCKKFSSLQSVFLSNASFITWEYVSMGTFGPFYLPYPLPLLGFYPIIKHKLITLTRTLFHLETKAFKLENCIQYKATKRQVYRLLY